MRPSTGQPRAQISRTNTECSIPNAASFARPAPVLEGGRETGTVQGNDLHEIVREAADIFERDILETGCLVRIENMPTIEADETQMLELFQNLIGNALKYRRSGESPLIRIRGKTDSQGFCEISVKDNGIGFEQQFDKLIFKPFQRLHSQGEYEGTGMGLAICRKIVELHGGRSAPRVSRGKVLHS